MRFPLFRGLSGLVLPFLLGALPVTAPVSASPMPPTSGPSPTDPSAVGAPATVPAGPAGEDDCLHSLGYGGTSKLAYVPRARPRGGAQDLLVCSTDNARTNSSFPLKTTVDFVPVKGDDSMGFYVVYSARLGATGTTISNNVGIFLFELDNGEVLVFGSGYGNIPGVNVNDAAFDMARVDTVIQACMGRTPATTPLRIVAPHGHGDHINPACNAELRALGYPIVEIAFHAGDLPLINSMAWTPADLALFHVLSTGASCQDEILGYDSPLGRIWFHARPGHTDGSIDCIIDVEGDVTNRFLVRGSQAGVGCAAIPGVRDIVNAHGNAVLTAPLPTLTSLSPSTGTSLGGTQVTLTGSQFTAAGAGLPQVLFGGVPATGVVVASDTQLTCTTPPGATGASVPVLVINNNGRSSSSVNFVYESGPSLTSVTPATGDWRGGTTVALTGSGFAGAGPNEVFFGANRATNVTVQNGGLVACRAPAGTPGTTVSISLRNNTGQAFLPSAYTYQADLAIVDVSPASGTALGGTTVTLSGFAFTGDGNPPTVSFGGVPASGVTLVSNTTVTCVVPPGTPGTTVQVSLSNSVGTANFNGYRYHAFPTLAGITPALGDASGGTTVTLTGSGFASDAPGTNTITFGGVAATGVSVLSDGSLTCVSPPGVSGQIVDVALSNANGGATLVGAWRYGQVLVLDSLLPASGTSLGGTPVTLSGSGFLAGPAGPNTVLFGGVAASGVTVVDDTTLTCQAPSGTPGAIVDVQVTNTNGTLALPGAFRYHAEPVVSGVSPASGHADDFTPVTLTGSGFLVDDPGPGFVVFGGIAASDVAVIDDSTLMCIAPPGTAGSATDVIFANQNGMSHLVAGFRYHAAPALSSLAPSSGPGTGGQRVTINGSGFLDDQAGANSVVFGSVPATSVTVISDSVLRADIPSGTPGTRVDVRVSNARGVGNLVQGYRYHARPTLASLAPGQGTFQGGTQVTITGGGFLIDNPGTNQVTFGGLAATGLVVLDDSTLRCLTPPGAVDATVDVVLSNQNGSVTLPLAFSYSVPAPTLIALTPPTGPASGGATISLSGAGFLDNGAGLNTVTFGATASPAVTVLDDQTLSCEVPAGPPGTPVDVVVTNTNGSATLSQGYRYHGLPTITQASPSGASSLGGTTITLTGSGFLLDAAGVNRVLFGSQPASGVVVLADDTLRCTAPPGVPGPLQIVVQNDNGESSPLDFSYHPLPTLVDVEPPFGPAYGGELLTLTGTGFLDNGVTRNEVRIGGKLSSSVTVVSDTRIECLSPRGDPGFADVRVTNENGSVLLPGGYHYGKLPPTVAGIAPDHGSVLGNTTVTVTGAGFLNYGAGINRVDFGGLAATNVVVADDSTLLCTTPRGLSGASVGVTLTNNNGTALVTPTFRYHVAPGLTSISPDGGKAFGGEKVTLLGSGFLNDSAGRNTVRFGTVVARDVQVLDDGTIVCTSPGGTAGAQLDVVVHNANGVAALPGAFQVAGGPPALAAVTPDRGLFAGGTQVELRGRGFAQAGAGRLRVWFGAAQATNVTVLDDGRATCSAPAGPVNTTVAVRIQNRNGVGAMYDAFTFESIPPRLVSLTPDHGSALGGTRVQLTGTDFLAIGAGTPIVTFAGQAATNVVVLDDLTLTCDAPAGAGNSTAEVRITNQNGSAALAGAFRYHALPTLGGIGPVHGPALGGTLVTLTGTGFVSDDAGANLVTFDGISATGVQTIDDTTLTCLVPPGTGGALAEVLVTNANGSAALLEAFRYHALPTITALTPARGPASGGTIVTILGTGFANDQAGANAVRFDGVPATGVTILDDETLACITPPGVAGRDVDVVLTNANGSVMSSGAFHFHPELRLSAITPARGPESGGTSVTLSGSGFHDDGAGPALVTFGGITAADVVIVDDTTLTCTTPAGKAGQTVDVMVANAHGDVNLATAFLFHGVPQLTAVTPDHGPAGGGTTLTVSGRGFVADLAGTNRITLGGLPASDVTVVDDTTLTCSAPAGTPGATVDVRLDNDNGTALLPGAFRYHALPTLAGLSPARGPSAGDTQVTLTGTGFSDDQASACAVTFGGAPATGVTVLDDSTVVCSTPAGTPLDDVDVVLANANGSATLPAAFHYHPTVTVTLLDRTRGPEVGGTAVTVSGAGFLDDGAGPALVTFGGLTASDVVVVDDATLTCTTPPGAAGLTVDIVVANAHGVATLGAAFLYHGVPQLTALAPDHGPAGGNATVTLTGRGFVADLAGTNRVTFGGQPAGAVTVVDDGTLTCSAPAGIPGTTVDVQVSNDNGSALLAGAFRYNALPTIAGLSPARGPSAGDTLVTLTGTGFTADQAGACAVTFGGVPATGVTVLDDSTLTCSTPPGTPLGDVDVVLANANGSATLPAAFHYHPTVTVTALDRTRGKEVGGTAVVLSGAGFLDDGAGPALVTFGGLTASNVVVVDDATLTCTTPSGVAGQTVDVMVANAHGVAVLAGAFFYHGVPQLSAVAPDHGPAGGGTAVTLTGRGFVADLAGANQVTFGGNPAASVTVVDDGTLTCSAPAGTPGATVDVQVANDNGTTLLVGAFRYHALPTLTSLTPARGPASGGTTVTLLGSGFSANAAGANTVTFGGVNATGVTVIDDGTLSCVTPSGTPATTVDVVLSNLNGSVSLASAFRYNPLPTLASIAPADGTPLGGESVTLNGSGFFDFTPGVTTVSIGGSPASNVAVLDDTTLTCTTPAGPGGSAVDVRLSNANGSATLAQAYSYRPAPTLVSLSPASGPAAGGSSVTLAGSGFEAASAAGTFVTFGGVASFNVTVIDDSTLTCEVPAGPPGSTVDVAVVNENGIASLGSAFRYHALPTLTTIDPPGGLSVANVPVTLSGSGFVVDQAGASTVLFGAQAALDLVVVDDTTITCTAPAQPAGTSVSVRVSNANGSATLPGFLYTAPAPTLTGIAPAQGSASGGTTVTLDGTNFQAPNAGVTQVSFGGALATGVSILGDGTLECLTPPGTVGQVVDVLVSNDNGSASLAAAFTYTPPAPTLTGIAPDHGSALIPTAVTLTGTGFQDFAAGSNSVTFGGLSALNVTTVDDSTLTCEVPAGAPGTLADASLTNANGGALLPGAFRYHAAPTLASVTPQSGTSLGGTLVTVLGSGFLADEAGPNSVRFAGVPATSVTVVDDSRLTCRVPAGASGSSVELTVSNGNGTVVLNGAYRYHARPTLTGVTASSGRSAGGTRVTLTGSGFRSDGAVVNIVSFGGLVASAVSVLDDTTIQCNTPAGSPGLAVQVTVANVNGTALLPNGFRYHARPTISAVTPGNGPETGGTTVTVSGSGFLNDSAGTNGVTFGGTPATAITVLTDTQLTCVTPAGPAGSAVDVTVANTNGSATLTGSFLYDVGAAPIVASVTPAKGSTQGATPVTVVGAGFDPSKPATVRFGPALASNVNVLDDGTIVCLTPASADSSWVDVSVQQDGGSSNLQRGFHFVHPPALIAVEPPVGVPEGGALVTLSGSGFLEGEAGENLVSFGGRPSPFVFVVSDELLVAEVPAGERLTTGDVEVRNDNGAAALSSGFRWQLALSTDLNRDGRGDLVVATPGQDGSAADVGAVHVFFGGDLPTLDRSTAQADVAVLADQAETGFGPPVATGDLDGDGIADLIVGAPLDDRAGTDAGAVYVFRGPLNAASPPRTTAEASLVLDGAGAGQRFGSALCLRDIDRDGIPDLLVGAPGDGSAEAVGRVSLFLGSPQGLSGLASARFSSEIPGDGFSMHLAAGDLDGDGWPEVVVGAPRSAGNVLALTLGTAPAMDPAGAVHVYHGGPLLAHDPAPEVWNTYSGSIPGAGFGSALVVRDLDGDHIDDLAVAAPGSLTGGAVHLFLGGAAREGVPALASDATLLSGEFGDDFGRSLAAGDVDGDGLADLLIGAPGTTPSGRAYLFLGGAALDRNASEADLFLDPEPVEGAEFGGAVALVDLDGDGLQDMVVTAPSFDALVSNAGRVYVFCGTRLLQSRQAANDDGTVTGDRRGDRFGRATPSDQ